MKTRDNNGRFLKGNHPSISTEFKKGRINKLSEETRRKIGIANSISQKGKKMSEETKKKLSIIFSGKNHPQYGKPKSEETRKKISLAQRGSKSVFWKGGNSEGYIKKLSGREWDKKRKEVYMRDKWTCQICKKHCHTDIQCHHVVPYRVSLDDNVENLITLCRKCHIKEEWKYYHNLNGQIEFSLLSTF